MFRVDTSTAAAELPAILPAGEPGFFTAGSPGGGIPATVPGADWFNTVQEELIALVVAGGLVPDKANRAQVLAALQKFFLVNNFQVSGCSPTQIDLAAGATVVLQSLRVNLDAGRKLYLEYQRVLVDFVGACEWLIVCNGTPITLQSAATGVFWDYHLAVLLLDNSNGGNFVQVDIKLSVRNPNGVGASIAAGAGWWFWMAIR